MKKLSILFSVVAIVVTVLTAKAVCQQEPFPMKEAIRKVKEFKFPFYDTREKKENRDFPIFYPVNNPKVPDLLFYDLQLTVSKKADYNGDLPLVFRKFRSPNNSYMLLAVEAGGTYDWISIYLCVADTVGNIYGSLNVSVMSTAYVKQYSIDKDMNVTVYSVIPTSKVPIMFDEFYKNRNIFEGYRQDRTYKIDSKGQFVEISEKRFPNRTFTYEDLAEEKIDIWDL